MPHDDRGGHRRRAGAERGDLALAISGERCGGAADKGTVFKINSLGAVITLHSFSGQGATPYGGLTQGSDENFYGTTQYGGASNLGTIFKMDSLGAGTTLHSFAGSDGANPTALLIQASE